MKKVFNHGINDADYPVNKYDYSKPKLVRLWTCPYYSRWLDMIRRCYSATYHKKQPTYIDCTVCDDWIYFSKFKAWMESQDWEDKQLDKDFLIEGNKVYSPEACIFIDPNLNKFMNDHGNKSGEFPTGVNYHKRSGKIVARVCNPITGKREWLGEFSCPDKAYDAWRQRKHEIACQLADLQQDERLSKALRVRYLSTNDR